MSRTPSVLNVVADSATTPAKSWPSYEFLADQVGAQLVRDETFITQIAEKMMTEAFLASARAALFSSSDPFDSVYISELLPDVATEAGLAELDSAAAGEGVATAPSFDDGLTD